MTHHTRPFDCVVVGAGLIGLCVARSFAERGARIAVVDAVGPGAGTTGTSGSLLTANEKRPHEYYRLGLAGMAAMRRLAGELDGASWFLGTGHLEWADSPQTRASLDARVTELNAWGYPIERMRPAEVTRGLEPELKIPGAVDDVVFFYDDSIIYPHILATQLIRRLHQLGGTFYYGGGGAQVILSGTRATGVITGDRKRLATDQVISCVGRWSEELTRALGINLPLVDPWSSTPEALGFQVITTPVPVGISRMVRMPGLSIRPAGGGRLMLHGRPEEAALHQLGRSSLTLWDDPLMPPPAQAGELVDKAKRVLENAQTLRVLSGTAAVRALSDDGLPVVGPLPGVSGVYCIVTHSGISLSALLGQLVSSEILDGQERDELRPFRPDRFLGDAWRTRPRPMRPHLDVVAPIN